MELLHAEKRIRQRDLDSVYEALFLRGITSFEVLLDELFFDILLKRKRYPAARNVKLRMTTTSPDALNEIVLQGHRKYLNWLPFRETKDRAKLYLEEGRPFTELDGGDENVISTVATIRNAVAHKSAYALGEFRRTVIGQQNLLRSERTPAGFLRSQIQANPKRVRFQTYIGEMARIAAKLG